MYEDRRGLAEQGATEVVLAYASYIGAEVHDCHTGSDPRLRTVLETLGPIEGFIPSADLVLEIDGQARVVEVKGRGGYGPVTVPERELDTLRHAGKLGWLYVVFNTTQPKPYELWTINQPAAMEWVQTLSAKRPKGIPRGVRHEAQFQLTTELILQHGEQVDLSAVPGLPAPTSSPS
jgi:hypothetical protein